MDINFLEECKTFYNSEFETANRYNSRLPYSLTILSILGSGEIFILGSVFPLTLSWWSILYDLFVLISVVSFLFSTYYFYKTFYGHSYSYIDVCKINESCTIQEKELKAQDNIETGEIDNLMNIILHDMLSEMYINCAMQNQVTNAHKSQAYTKMTHAFLINVICVFICFAINVIISNYKGGSLYVC